MPQPIVGASRYKGLATHEEFAERMRDVDLLDGRQDGR